MVSSLARHAAAISFVSIVWIGTFFSFYEALYSPVAGSVAAIVGATCFLLTYRAWRPHPVLKLLIVATIVVLSKIGPYVYDEVRLEHATSCAWGEQNPFAFSVASTQLAHEVLRTGLAVTVKHEKCYDFLAAAIPSQYFVFVHKLRERDGYDNLVLRYQTCLEDAPTVTSRNGTLLVGIHRSGSTDAREKMRQEQRCAVYKTQGPIVTQQRGDIGGMPVRYQWIGQAPSYNRLEPLPQRVVDDLQISWQDCRLAC